MWILCQKTLKKLILFTIFGSEIFLHGIFSTWDFFYMVGHALHVLKTRVYPPTPQNCLVQKPQNTSKISNFLNCSETRLVNFLTSRWAFLQFFGPFCTSLCWFSIHHDPFREHFHFLIFSEKLPPHFLSKVGRFRSSDVWNVSGAVKTLKNHRSDIKNSKLRPVSWRFFHVIYLYIYIYIYIYMFFFLCVSTNYFSVALICWCAPHGGQWNVGVPCALATF